MPDRTSVCHSMASGEMYFEGGGHLGVVIPNKWFQANYAEKLRETLAGPQCFVPRELVGFDCAPFVDVHDGLLDNCLIIGDLIACDPKTIRETERSDPFPAQEKAIADILRTQQEVVAREEVPREMDPTQEELEVLLRPFRTTAPDREVVSQAMEVLQKPLPKSVNRELRKLKKSFEASPAGAGRAAKAIVDQASHFVGARLVSRPERVLLERKHLHLICFEEIVRAPESLKQSGRRR